LDRRLGGPQSRSGHSGGEEKNSQLSPEIEPPNLDRIEDNIKMNPMEIGREDVDRTYPAQDMVY
jgi:hypothetical protein